MILHIDMDAFYASVEQLDDPRLKGRCVIVGGTSGRGVVCAASYEARKYGVRSAMPLYQARQKCPGAVCLSPRMQRYREVSGRIMAILGQFSPRMEPVSIDEAYVDISGSQRLQGDVEQVARRIKKRIQDSVGLTCSVGGAPAKFLAKIASDMDKPDGLTIIAPEAVSRFIASLAIEKVPGVGRKMHQKLNLLGVHTLGDINNLPAKTLVNQLGKFGRRLMALAHGIDPAAVTPRPEHKSISSEHTLARDTRNLDLLQGCLLKQAEEVGRQLRQAGLRARTITLKIKHADFTQLTRSLTLAVATQSSKTIYTRAVELLHKYPFTRKIRLIGVGASGLTAIAPAVQLDLFDHSLLSNSTWERVDRTVDRIREKFGRNIVKRASIHDPHRSE